MILSTGVKSLAFALCLTAASSLFFQASAQSQLSPELKQKLAQAASAATTVPLKENAAPALKNIDAIDENELEDLEPIPAPVEDADEIAPLRITLDKPEIVRLDRDAINVIVGSNENLRVVPDTNKNLVLIAKKPGSTYFRALDVDGKVIMQRHVIIGSPNKNYIRIRRACANGTAGCKQYSVYYCPDMCHEVSVVQDAKAGAPAIPEATPASAAPGNASGNAETETPVTTEPPPGE